MTTLQNCVNYLRSTGVPFAHTTHSAAYTAAEVALAEHIPANRLAKTVMVRDDESYVMVVVPADADVDLARLRTVVGASELYPADERDLFRFFPNAEVGAMPPLGSLFNFRVYLDRKVANREFIAFNAGSHRDFIHMRVSDFWELIHPVLGDFCEVSASAGARRGSRP
jgi:Ala-tRNA(Pro) deacylase